MPKKRPRGNDESRPLRLPSWLRGMLRKHGRTCPACKAPAGRADAMRIQFRIHESRPDCGIGHVDAGVAFTCRGCRAPFEHWIPFKPGIAWATVLGFFLDDDQPDPAAVRSPRKSPANPRRRAVRPSVPDDRKRLGPISDGERDRLLDALRRCRTTGGFMRALGIDRQRHPDA
jgi:hypothetical protein